MGIDYKAADRVKYKKLVTSIIKIIILIFNLLVLTIMNYKVYIIDTDKAVLIPLIISPILFLLSSIIGLTFKSLGRFAIINVILIAIGGVTALILSIF